MGVAVERGDDRQQTQAHLTLGDGDGGRFGDGVIAGIAAIAGRHGVSPGVGWG